jgi:hypothetical protein
LPGQKKKIQKKVKELIAAGTDVNARCGAAPLLSNALRSLLGGDIRAEVVYILFKSGADMKNMGSDSVARTFISSVE